MNPNHVPTRRSLAALLLGSTIALPLTGCGEDPQVAGAVDFGARFATISEDYRKLAASRSIGAEGGPVANTSDLSGLLGSLNQLSGGTPEQSAAAALLRAQVATDLGTLESVRAGRVEADSRQLFALIGGLADAAARIENLSNVEISLADDRERLAETRAAAERDSQDLRGVVAGMREPVERLDADRERRMAEIARIDDEIAILRRDAAAAGSRAGLPLFEEAADLNDQVIRLRTRTAIESGQLADASNELSLAETQLVASEALAGSAQSAMKELEDFSAALDREAKAGRDLATTLRGEAETLLARVEELRGESLDSLYQSAMTAFDEAAAASDSAGNVARDSANQYKIGSLRSRGTLIQSRIAGLDAEAILRERLAAAGTLFGGAAKAKPALEAILARRATLLEEGKAAYGEALALIESMGSEQPTVARTKSSIEASMAMLEGKGSPSAVKDPGPGGVGAPGGSAGPFATAKALVDHVNSTDGRSAAGGLAMFSLMHASSPAARSFIDMARSMSDALSPLMVAAEKAYGAEAVANAATNGMGGMNAGPMVSSLTNLSLVSEDLESAQATSGGGATISLIKVDGSWFIDADALVAAMGPQAQGLAAAGPMMAMMKPAFTEAAIAVAGRIEAGEFADAGAAMAAFNEAMKAAMAKAMGGGFGGGSQGGFGGGRP